MAFRNRIGPGLLLLGPSQRAVDRDIEQAAQDAEDAELQAEADAQAAARLQRRRRDMRRRHARLTRPSAKGARALPAALPSTSSMTLRHPRR
jgi:hypothetical protein